MANYVIELGSFCPYTCIMKGSLLRPSFKSNKELEQ